MNRGSNPCRGAKFQNRVLTRLSPFPFYNSLGSNGARFRTVRTGPSVRCRPSKPLFAQPRGATGVVRGRVVGGTTRSPDWSGEACQWPDREGLVWPSGCLGSCEGDYPVRGARSSRFIEKLLRDARVELVHVHSPDALWRPAPWSPAEIARLRRILRWALLTRRPEPCRALGAYGGRGGRKHSLNGIEQFTRVNRFGDIAVHATC